MKKEILQPKIDPVLTESKIDAIKDLELVDGFLFQNETLSNTYLENIEISNCRFEHITFDCKIEKVDLLDVVFDHCDLSNLNFCNQSVHRVIFQNCKLVGTTLIESSIEDVAFIDCTLLYSNFTASKINFVLFKHCNCEEASFNEMSWKQLNFIDCNMAQTEFLGTSLKGLDMTSNQIEGIKVDPRNLFGMKVTSYQAIYLSQLLGLVIQDDF